MQDQKTAIVFDEERASSYEKRFDKITAIRDAMHLLIRVILGDLPDSARILVVGAGTGLELIYLAREFPGWQFAAVEPAAPMLALCRQKAEAAGVASRCTFHGGYVDSLPETEPFHAATCLLVSHFILQQEERSAFFRQIGNRLRPGGTLVSSDLVSDMATPEHASLLEVWLRMLRYSGVPADEIEKFRTSYGKDVAMLPPRAIETILTNSGFELPVPFYQALLIRAWYSKRAL